MRKVDVKERSMNQGDEEASMEMFDLALATYHPPSRNARSKVKNLVRARNFAVDLTQISQVRGFWPPERQ